MKKILFIILFFSIILYPVSIKAETSIGGPKAFSLNEEEGKIKLTWQSPESYNFAKSILFRTTIPIEDYFSFEAVSGICDLIYEGKNESFTDFGLAVNLNYYYILFTEDKKGEHSKAVIIERTIPEKEAKIKNQRTGTLAGASASVVNEVSYTEAGIVYNFNKVFGDNSNAETNTASSKLALFIIVKSPNDLNNNDKEAISYFIDSGTPTTIFLGSGERAGVLNSYLSVFDKLPTNILEWQDVIKIANGRWPNERNLESEKQASEVYFSTIYKREPNMNNPNDNAAVTVIAYGLRPAERNLENENKAIEIYRSIFGKDPAEASDWDLVRAIAYSGAVR